MRPPGPARRYGELPLAVFFFLVAPAALFIAVILVSLWILSSGGSHAREARVLLSTQGASPPASAAAGGETRQTVLYVGSRDGPTKLVPYPFTIDVAQGTKEQVERVVQALQGPFDDPKILPTVPKGTRLLAVFLTRKRLLINLSREFSQLHIGGSQGTRLTLFSLVDSLIDLGIADEVQILVQGREELGFVDHIDISRPLGFQTSLLAGRGGGEVAEGPRPPEPRRAGPAHPASPEATPAPVLSPEDAVEAPPAPKPAPRIPKRVASSGTKRSPRPALSPVKKRPGPAASSPRPIAPPVVTTEDSSEGDR